MNENMFSFVNIIRDKHPFLAGMGSVMDISGTSHSSVKMYKTAQEADIESIRADWEAIGLDLKNAIEYEYEKEHV